MVVDVWFTLRHGALIVLANLLLSCVVAVVLWNVSPFHDDAAAFLSCDVMLLLLYWPSRTLSVRQLALVNPLCLLQLTFLVFFMLRLD